MTETLKQRVHDFWQANPCGQKFVSEEVGSRSFFQSIEKHRYETEWHIPEVVRFERWRDCDVLEVGCGLGSDGVLFARAGARYTGIDLTERAVELAGQRFALEGLSGKLRVADSEALPFPDSSFDLVYSHGVLHHTPDIDTAVSEIHRVLRPGGTAMVMLYHRRSYNYYVNIMTLRRIGVRLLRFGWGPALVHRLTGEDNERLVQLRQAYLSDRRRLLSRKEFLNQNTDGVGNPLARVYSRSEADQLFSGFAHVQTEVHFLNKKWMPLIGRLLTRRVEQLIASRIGWHLWISARK